MSAPYGRVEIAVTRDAHGVAAGERLSYARLMTSEVRDLIARQNVDVSEINCMRWPLFGLSRHATCKLLMSRSDLMDLLASEPNNWNNTTYNSDDDGFAIWFIVQGADESNRTRFPRMHIADIHPLMISQYGIPGWGEAYYVVTFKCDRWAARSNRPDVDLSGSILGQYWSRSWDPSAFVDSYQTADTPTVDSVITTGITTQLAQTSYWRMFRTGLDTFSDSGVASAKYSDAEGLRGMDTMLQKPLTVVLDEIAARSGVAIGYKPKGWGAEGGQHYDFRIVDIDKGSERMVAFMNDYREDIIAGSFKDLLDGTGSGILNGLSAKATIPNVIAQAVRPKRAIVGVHRNQIADGTPPDVFSQSKLSTDTSSTGKFESPHLNDPFSRSIPTTAIDRVAVSNFPKFGEGGAVHLTADNWLAASRADRRPYSVSAYSSPYSEAETVANEVATRWANRYKAGICDIWFRGWIMPVTDEIWPGGSWLELRLQTDGRGFGFPTTRICGSVDDPLLGPVPDDRQHDVEGSGMVKTWRGEDGRVRVHVGMPFGIPCLIRIVAATRITAGIPAWRYDAKIVYRPAGDTAASAFKGGLEGFSAVDANDPIIVAYNVNEANNTATFAGPGYKLPLAQAGFDVLPIGQDRDGTLRDVVVPAMLYMAATGAPERVCAYFALTNAIDGDCV